MLPTSIWIGFEPRETEAFVVARESIYRFLPRHVPVKAVILDRLRRDGIYTRPTERRLGRLIDVLSKTDDYNGEMSTEFSVSRFFVKHLAEKKAERYGSVGWTVFADCDVMVRSELSGLFDRLDESKAVMCVKHNHVPELSVKMDDCLQTRYARKNWSSVMAFNGDHPANKRLTLEMLNSLPGRDLHAFCWLKDGEIGELPPSWNWLVGHSSGVEPKLVHFTDGIPTMTGFENVAYADEWRATLERAVAG